MCKWILCVGLKPAESEPCFLQPCALDQNRASGIEVTYSWKTTGYTPCSASCLGGKPLPTGHKALNYG
ncbi:ADAMTSL1 [Cordylochernes scorpioides]|uniref:ADAMTSL1 n=1 Tax=Cordylochernes scorpioides TaxID=51811 RepID=A0ABY6L6S7_9ARAC|nr:ADAMTSL1 [Cordylochernes scorpioides]